MIVLDTNIVSELLGPRPDPGVVEWVEALPLTSVFTTAVTQSEILYGIAILPPGQRRTSLEEAVRGIFDEDMAGRVLPFDGTAAEHYAAIAAARRAAGQPISQLDAQIAAISRSRGGRLATRNLRDFVDCGLELVDPWSASRI